MAVASQQELVERIWARDATVWTGADEDRWLGWLDEPKRMQERVGELADYAEAARTKFDTFVLLGMGGSSLAPEVLRRTFERKNFHVLDTTHPAMIRHAEGFIDPAKTLFIVASKSGTTLETRCHLDYFRDRCGKDFNAVAITDPGSPLADAGIEQVFYGEPTIGGRYSALSVFGLVPAALMEIDLERVLDGAVAMADACRGEASPGLQLGLQLGEAWLQGRDKVCIPETDGRFGLWAEQLIAESTGKQGKGLVPAPGESAEGPDRQPAQVELGDAYEIGAEFFRWEFAVAVAGSILEINPFDQPDVQAAKDKTMAVLERGTEPSLAPAGSLDELLSGAGEGEYFAICAFIDPNREDELEPLVRRVRETGRPLMRGLGPRYLHSTGQLHKGGPNSGRFIQVVDDLGDPLAIPGAPYDFRRLIAAQAEGDFEALRERGRRIVRVRLEDIR